MVPTQVEAGDIPTAFATGRVSAMMTSPLSTGVSSQAWDYTSVYVDVNAWLPKNVVFVNTEAFEALARRPAGRADGSRRNGPRRGAGR